LCSGITVTVYEVSSLVLSFITEVLYHPTPVSKCRIPKENPINRKCNTLGNRVIRTKTVNINKVLSKLEKCMLKRVGAGA
jgi:hypothetical protein